jgi:hypothetical protein
VPVWVRFPIPLSIRTCDFPACGLPMILLAWLRCLPIAAIPQRRCRPCPLADEGGVTEWLHNAFPCNVSIPPAPARAFTGQSRFPRLPLPWRTCRPPRMAPSSGAAPAFRHFADRIFACHIPGQIREGPKSQILALSFCRWPRPSSLSPLPDIAPDRSRGGSRVSPSPRVQS